VHIAPTSPDQTHTTTESGRDQVYLPLTGRHVLQIAPLAPWLERSIAQNYGALRLPDIISMKAFLLEHAPTIRVAITSGKVGMDEELIEALPALRAIVNFGAGYDTIDLSAAGRRGIRISNTPDVLNDCVADTALALLLDVFRRTSAADRFVRSGEWKGGPFPLTSRLTGKRIGIVGLGRIGRAIALRLEGFSCEIFYHNRNRSPDSPYEFVPSLKELAANSDALIVAAAGGPSTNGLISDAVLDALGPAGYLVNVGRGSVVDQDALVDALKAGKIAGAGLDVYAHEPSVPEALLAMDNVVLLPHVGSGTLETRQAMAELVLKNLDHFARRGFLFTPVN
jgi:lactate dehydrogenase-like 2-hydroxyacid dehydrogenase